MHEGGLVVATEEGRIIGFGGIEWLYILPQHQRAGFGSEILRRLENIGWEAGLGSLRVHSAPRAVDFYQRHGYTLLKHGDQRGHDHEGVDMMKERP